MTIKVTLLLQLSTAASDATRPVHRIGGWSETYYYPGTSIPTAITQTLSTAGQFNGLALDRAGLLPLGGSIIGARFQQVNPVALSQSLPVNFPSTSGLEADVPQSALLCRVPALNANNVRRLILRGLPDAVLTEGEFNFNSAFTATLRQFFVDLGAYQFRGRDLSQPTVKIVGISAAGIVTTETPHTLAPGNMVRILRSRTPDGDLLGGRFQVASIGPGNNVLTLLNWLGEATTGGSVRLDAIVFVNIDSANIQIGRVITRRVGRPFVAFRGRRSRKTG